MNCDRQSSAAIELWDVTPGADVHGPPLIVKEGIPTSLVISPGQPPCGGHSSFIQTP